MNLPAASIASKSTPVRSLSPRLSTILAGLTRAIVAALLAPCALPSRSAETEAQPSVTPYRPSVSTPAALSAPGWVELELGGLRVNGPGTSRRDSLPYTIKLAFSEDWGIRIGGDAGVRQQDETGQRISGGGDTGVVLKRRFAVDDASAFGFEAGATFPTARTGLGSGKSDYSLNGIYSADLDRYHTDINLVLTRVGQVDAGVSRNQALWAASLSRAITDRWGVVGELFGTRQRGSESTAQLLAAASYNVSPSLTLDAGLSRSIRSGGPDWSMFAGLTVLLGRLF